MNQVELDTIYYRQLGDGDQLDKLVRTRVNDIKNDPDLRNRYGCPLLSEDADLGGYDRKKVQEYTDLENTEKTIREEDIARFNIISSTPFPTEKTSNLPDPGVTGETDQ